MVNLVDSIDTGWPNSSTQSMPDGQSRGVSLHWVAIPEDSVYTGWPIQMTQSTLGDQSTLGGQLVDSVYTT